VKSIAIFDKARRDALVRELKTYEMGASPHIASFLGAYFEAGQIKLGLEYMNRGSLQDVINKYGALKEDVLASIAKQCLLGLQALHANKKVHRDIKPANVLVDMFGTVKISDFGILADLDRTDDLCSTYVGTAVFMSPERIKGESYGFPSDIWSLGMSLITCALGKFPFDTDKGYFHLMSQINQEKPPQLGTEFSSYCRSFVASCLVKEPDQRGSLKALLSHPFVSKVDPKTPAKWPFEMTGGESELADVDFILDLLVQEKWQQKSTKLSLADMSRVQRLAGLMGLSVDTVRTMFENKLVAAPQETSAAPTDSGALKLSSPK